MNNSFIRMENRIGLAAKEWYECIVTIDEYFYKWPYSLPYSNRKGRHSKERYEKYYLNKISK